MQEESAEAREREEEREKKEEPERERQVESVQQPSQERLLSEVVSAFAAQLSVDSTLPSDPLISNANPDSLSQPQLPAKSSKRNGGFQIWWAFAASLQETEEFRAFVNERRQANGGLEAASRLRKASARLRSKFPETQTKSLLVEYARGLKASDPDLYRRFKQEFMARKQARALELECLPQAPDPDAMAGAGQQELEACQREVEREQKRSRLFEMLFGPLALDPARAQEVDALAKRVTLVTHRLSRPRPRLLVKWWVRDGDERGVERAGRGSDNTCADNTDMRRFPGALDKETSVQALAGEAHLHAGAAGRGEVGGVGQDPRDSAAADSCPGRSRSPHSPNKGRSRSPGTVSEAGAGAGAREARKARKAKRRGCDVPGHPCNDPSFEITHSPEKTPNAIAGEGSERFAWLDASDVVRGVAGCGCRWKASLCVL